MVIGMMGPYRNPGILAIIAKPSVWQTWLFFWWRAFSSSLFHGPRAPAKKRLPQRAVSLEVFLTKPSL